MSSITTPPSRKNYIKKKRRTFKTYIRRVLRKIHPNLGLSRDAAEIINSLIEKVLADIAFESAKVTHFNKKQTFSVNHCKAVVKILFPGELKKQALQQGKISLQKFDET